MVVEKHENSMKFIEMADELFCELEKEYNLFKQKEKYLSKNEIEKRKRNLGSIYGLVCENYLKGLILSSHGIEVSRITDITQEEKEKIKEVLNNISEEEEYKLLIGDSNTLKDLTQRFQLTKKVKDTLFKQSLKKVGGNGHHLGAFFEYMSDDIKNAVLMQMVDYYSAIEKPVSKEEWREFLRGFFRISTNNLDEFNNNKDKLKQTIGDSEVSEAFFKGRYGHVEQYIPKLDALHYLSNGIRESIKKEYINVISLTDGIGNGYIDANSIRYIFPDLNSKIYVFDNGKKITRVYSLMKYEDFLKDSIGMNLEGMIFDNRNHMGYTICPEFGIEKMIEMSCNGLGEKVINNRLTPLFKTLHISPGETSIIICTVDEKEKGYAYSIRKI